MHPVEHEGQKQLKNSASGLLSKDDSTMVIPFLLLKQTRCIKSSLPSPLLFRYLLSPFSPSLSCFRKELLVAAASPACPHAPSPSPHWSSEAAMAQIQPSSDHTCPHLTGPYGGTSPLLISPTSFSTITIFLWSAGLAPLPKPVFSLTATSWQGWTLASQAQEPPWCSHIPLFASITSAHHHLITDAFYLLFGYLPVSLEYKPKKTRWCQSVHHCTPNASSELDSENSTNHSNFTNKES
jgi:hypothetical protein